MSNLVTTVLSLSPSFGSSNQSQERALHDYQAWLQAARHPPQHEDREAQYAEHLIDIYRKARDDSAQEELQRAIQEADEPLRCPYRPSHQETPSHKSDQSSLLQAESGAHVPRSFLVADLPGNVTPPGPIGYPLYDPYSPFQLEKQYKLRNIGIQWGEAFQDLLSFQDGEHISDDFSQEGIAQTCEWVRRICEQVTSQEQKHEEASSQSALAALEQKIRPWALLAGMRKSRDNMGGNQEDDFDDEEGDDDLDVEDEAHSSEEQMTELDLYKHLWGFPRVSSNQEPSTTSQSQSRSYAHMQHDSTPTEEDGAKPSILSTLTTTERTTLQDGTIHTRAVLKKRFSDGREECNETTHTQNPPPKPQCQPPAKAIQEGGKHQDSPDGVGDGKKSKGWFWS